MPGQRHVITVFAFGSCDAADVNAGYKPCQFIFFSGIVDKHFDRPKAAHG